MAAERRHLAGIVVLILFIAAIGTLVLLRNRAPHPEERVDKVASIEDAEAITPRGKRPVLSPDFDWKDQDAERLEDLLQEVGVPEERGPDWEFPFEQTLQPGESMITEGWEVSEGVFQFTTLTPTEVTFDGETAYQISAKVTEINLDGTTKLLSMPQVITRSEMSASIQIVQSQPVMSSGEPVGPAGLSYRLDVTPEKVDGGIRLKGKAAGSANRLE